jgi:FAD/FMN-containing dehydrogenase
MTDTRPVADMFRARLDDNVVLEPGDAPFADAIAPHNRAVVHTPDLVVVARTEADVIEAIRLAHEHGMTLAVQNTGHGAAPVSGGILLLLDGLDSIAIDPASRTATIGGGAAWAPVIAAAGEHGLFPITGSSGTVGVVGYLLGGGLGPLSRSHGFSSDYIEGARVVTGTGEVVDVTAETDPDLLWALRGGKYRLGVVTEIRIRLVDLATLYGGALFFQEHHIAEALHAWADWLPTAPDDVTTSAAILRYPDLEFIPAPFRGQRLLTIRFAYPGGAQHGEELAAPLRAFAPVYLDALGELPATEVGRIHNDPPDPGPSAVRGWMLDRLDHGTVDALLAEVGPGTDAPILATELRHLGAATTRDIPGGSALSGRRAAFTVGTDAVNPATFAVEVPAAVARLRAALLPWTSAENTPNFIGIPDSAEHAASAWSAEARERLASIRTRLDPAGILR